MLVGRVGGNIERGKDGAEIDSIASPQIPVGLPSLLITRRPDVMAAEYALIGADAGAVGAADALPALSLFPAAAQPLLCLSR